jgi:hypothetical protein
MLEGGSMPYTTIGAIAAAMMAPGPPLKPPITFHDYPEKMLRRNEEGAAVIALLIDPRGIPVACEVEQIIGTDVSKISCAKYMKAQFPPAIDNDGQPAFGLYRTVSNFWLPGNGANFPVKLAPAFTLKVKSAGASQMQPTVVAVAITVGVDGKAGSCRATKADVEARLANAACKALQSGWIGKPRTDRSGKPVSYVSEILVAFEPA